MTYLKRIPTFRLVLTRQEYNTLIGIFTKNADEQNDDNIIEIATMTKEKFLKYGVPNQSNEGNIEIELKLFPNEVVDIISQLLIYSMKRMNEIDYYQVLLKVRENMNNNND